MSNTDEDVFYNWISKKQLDEIILKSIQELNIKVNNIEDQLNQPSTPMTEITLTKLEMAQLMEIKKRFPDVEYFRITQTHESGIGATTRVHLALFSDEPDTMIDITDVSVW